MDVLCSRLLFYARAAQHVNNIVCTLTRTEWQLPRLFWRCDGIKSLSYNTRLQLRRLHSFTLSASYITGMAAVSGP